MLIKNTDDSLVNSSLERVIKFANPSAYLSETDPWLLEQIGKGSHAYFPVVEFILPDGKTQRVLVMNEVFWVESPEGQVQASREQVSTTGCYSVANWSSCLWCSPGPCLSTKHRVSLLNESKLTWLKYLKKVSPLVSQGCLKPGVGQAYVALSRDTSLKGLQVLNFEINKVFSCWSLQVQKSQHYQVVAHPKVLEWSKTLEMSEAWEATIDPRPVECLRKT